MRTLVLLLLLICCGTALASEGDQDVAQAFARAANFIYYVGFEHDSVEAFSESELRIFGENRDALNLMIREALGVQHSVGGAVLSAHFGLEENLDLLRYHVLEPGRAYGWEGGLPVSDDWFYDDYQYVYHSHYIKAIEQISGKPLHEVVELSQHERDRINAIASDPRHESWEWALWISRKFGT